MIEGFYLFIYLLRGFQLKVGLNVSFWWKGFQLKVSFFWWVFGGRGFQLKVNFWLNGFSFEARFSVEGGAFAGCNINGGDEGFRGGYFVLGVVGYNL